MTMRVKICGLSDPQSLHAAIDAGAAYVGFVFFAKSPRNIEPADAFKLALDVPPGVAKVALTVDPDDTFLDRLTDSVPVDMIQLHGSEPPERVADIRRRTGLPVMKALGLADPEDLPKIDAYASVADQLLIDAKPPKASDIPGGNGVTFDWRLIAGRRWPVPWLLAGGLTTENVADAIRLTGATQVDVSSAVETAPGHKDPTLIRQFISAAMTAGQAA